MTPMTTRKMTKATTRPMTKVRSVVATSGAGVSSGDVSVP